MPKHITSAVKRLRTFLSFKDFNLLKSLAPSARSFFNFMTACYFPCLWDDCSVVLCGISKRLQSIAQVS